MVCLRESEGFKSILRAGFNLSLQFFLSLNDFNLLFGSFGHLERSSIRSAELIDSTHFADVVESAQLTAESESVQPC
ncbi:hypothetical protein Taro_050267 [Colocasia esculenta]|uniref:Uncharacterized protein n=1 Tax=Colocasia esculenta TaxID=4460 RepID=A0A843XCZ2_COLES|nr:hypothetical protein [Colocasia esculenta]